MRSYSAPVLAGALAFFGAAEALSGTFDLLTYNIAGLPEWISDNGIPGSKDKNTERIGSIIAQQGYDVVHVQEDFSYHKELYSKDNHPHRTKTKGNVPFGDGLNTLSNYPFSNFDRNKWDKCYINEADCLTPKGFTYMRMNIDGAEIDFYNLHADAGDKSKDEDARSAGIDELLREINNKSIGRPVIIAGDVNDRYYTKRQSISKLINAGFADVWVNVINGGVYPLPGSTPPPCQGTACETIDKVIYRSGDVVKLTPTAYEKIPHVFLQPDGNKLSDHDPVHVNFSWSS